MRGGRSDRGRRGHGFGGRGRRGVGVMGGQSGQAATRVVSKQERSGGAGHGEGATEMGNGSLGMVKVGGKSGDGLSRLRTKRRVKVVGARKVWGTLYTTTSLAVRNVISNIAKNSTEQLVIKRKYKENPNSRKVSKWWFVIRGEENLLQQLQLKWQAVSAWKLQDVVAYADDSSLVTSEAPSTQDEPSLMIVCHMLPPPGKFLTILLTFVLITTSVPSVLVCLETAAYWLHLKQMLQVAHNLVL